MQGENVGAIYYEVAADTSKLLPAEKAVAESMDKMASATKKADGATKNLNLEKTKLAKAIDGVSASLNKERSAFGGLTGVIAAYLSMRTVQSIAALSDAYQQNASRIRNATKSTEEYEQVQARMLETANGTFRSLGEAQEVYLAVADTLRDLKYSTSEVLDITDSFSYALVRDAARADQATTAMDAWSKALQKGKLDADGWVSIVAAIPSVVEAIATATGKSTTEIRQLGVTGTLNINALNEALLQARDTNKEMADAMDVSTKDAMTQLTNAFTVFFGKVNEASGASKVFTDNVAAMAKLLQDPATINAAADFASGVVSSLTKIIEKSGEVVKFVKWMGEEVAANLHGVAIGDVARTGQAVAQLEKELSNFEKARGRNVLSRMFDGYTDAELDKEIATRKAKIKAYRDGEAAALRTAPTAAPAQSTTAPRPAAARPRVAAAAPKDSDAKKAAAAAEKLRKEEEARAKRAQEYIYKLEDELTKQDQITAVERVRLDVKRNSIKLTESELQKALEVAAAVDLRVEKEKQIEEHLNRENAQLAAQQQLQAEILGYSLKIAGAMMASGARGEMEERARMEEAFARRIVEIQDQRRNALAKAEEKDKARINRMYDDVLTVEQAYQQKSLEAYQQYTEKKKELDADWRVGALQAIAEYAETANNKSKQVGDIFGKVASGMEDALVKFAMTGKLNFSDLANSVISDIARMAARAAASGIMNMLGGLIGNYFGTPSTAGGSQYSLGTGSSGLGLKLPGRASGGPVESGKMYRVNERGSPELLNVGGNQFLMMGKQSGRVTNSEAGAGAGGAGAGVQVNVYNSTDSDVSATTREDGNGQIIDIVVKRAVSAVANDIASGGVVANTMQSTYALNRGAGTPRFSR